MLLWMGCDNGSNRPREPWVTSWAICLEVDSGQARTQSVLVEHDSWSV